MTIESATLWGCAALILGTPPRLSRFPLGCLSHTQFGLPPAPDLNADECRLCFLGAALVSEKMNRCEPLARVRHAEMCARTLRQAPPHTYAHTNIQCVPFRPAAASQRVTGTATFLLVQQKTLSRRSRLCYSSSSSSTAEEEIAVEGLGPSLATACPDY